jgi:mono/diheme cytochrome c family protein
MARPRLKHAALFASAAAVLVACGSEQIKLDAADTGNRNVQEGAKIFADRCGGCHTLDAAGTDGSAVKVRNRERTDGPNFNTRREDRDSVLYAIRNGGSSGAIMPENIVTGEDAEKVAEFLSKYAGRDASGEGNPASPGNESSQTP